MFGRDEADPLISRDEIFSPKNRLDVTNYKFHKRMIVKYKNEGGSGTRRHTNKKKRLICKFSFGVK